MFIVKFAFALIALASSALCFPQSSQDIAAATRLTEQTYYDGYHRDVPGLLPIDNKAQTEDYARDESEGYGSKIYGVYDGVQKKSSDIFNPKPVVDTITKESEKYGNQGDQLQGIQKIVVGVMSVVSNAINALLDAPGSIATNVVKTANVQLNKLGGKIVGLMK